MNFLNQRDKWLQIQNRRLLAACILSILMSIFIGVSIQWYVKKQLCSCGFKLKSLNKEMISIKDKIKFHSDIIVQKNRLQSKSNIIKTMEYNNAVIMAVLDDIVQVVSQDIVLTNIELLSNMDLSGRSESESAIMILMDRLQALSWAGKVHLDELIKEHNKFKFTLKISLRLETFNDFENF